MQITTICLLLHTQSPRKLLLGLKKRGFGKGKYGGFGGKVEAGETIREAAIRELYEESGIQVVANEMQKRGVLTFRFPTKPSWNQVAHVFVAEHWEGEAVESHEMKPTWFLIDEIPYHKMWQDASYWLPPILEGQQIEADFSFHADHETVDEVRIKV